MGVILWYRVAFPRLQLTVSNDVSGGAILSDADITVEYGFGQPGKFDVHLAALPLSAHRKLAGELTGERGTAGGVEVEITLGYLESPGSRRPVLTGRVDGMTVSERFPPLGVRLTGYEEAAFKLLTTQNIRGKDGRPRAAQLSAANSTPAEAADTIVTMAHATLADGATPKEPRQPGINLDGRNAFDLLEQLAGQYGAEVLVQEGVVQFGTAVTHPAATGPALPSDQAAVLALLNGEDSLIVPGSKATARLAEFEPVQAGATGKQRVVTDLPAQTSVPAFDFTVLGLPELRAGQRVAASVEGYQNPFQGFRLLQVTHSFSPRTGYVCTGRAAVLKDGAENRRNTEAARLGSPMAIADAIAGRIRDARTVSPSVDAGRVRSAKHDKRVADVVYGQDDAPAAVSPSVDLPVEDSGSVLRDKPLAAPFAWHKVGLSVPVYEGMRALLNEVRGSREDSVVTGFLWTNEEPMDRPKAQAGDWWLCLPTKLSAGSPPRPEGKGVSDLTAADGRRVVEAVGLKLTVGTSGCSDVGERPTEGPAEEFVLSHSSGAEVRIDKDGNVTVSAGAGKDVTVSASGGKVALSAGGATLTVGEGKVAIS
ncbi:hypothetical protein [Streptomyces lydicus]|uniref:Type IV secretion protein Rhs n=1 Tax=Streptomyces lydicus TaxID=47763 RepID=A0A1D7VPB7_9ACTN|nr:hypothetical protein [Streptomyces lydicus]AOP48606.1 hypothetical protein SL103_22325 [Streptomyces lydicus]